MSTSSRRIARDARHAAPERGLLVQLVRELARQPPEAVLTREAAAQAALAAPVQRDQQLADRDRSEAALEARELGEHRLRAQLVLVPRIHTGEEGADQRVRHLRPEAARQNSKTARRPAPAGHEGLRSKRSLPRADSSGLPPGPSAEPGTRTSEPPRTSWRSLLAGRALWALSRPRSSRKGASAPDLRGVGARSTT